MLGHRGLDCGAIVFESVANRRNILVGEGDFRLLALARNIAEQRHHVLVIVAQFLDKGRQRARRRYEHRGGLGVGRVTAEPEREHAPCGHRRRRRRRRC